MNSIPEATLAMADAVRLVADRPRDARPSGDTGLPAMLAHWNDVVLFAMLGSSPPGFDRRKVLVHVPRLDALLNGFNPYGAART